MNKWEYLCVTAFFAENLALTKIGIDGIESKEWKGKPLNQVLKRLGEQGWELTGHPVPSMQKDTVVLIFKRPLA